LITDVTPLTLTFSVASAPPDTVGLKVTEIVQAVKGAIELPQVFFWLNSLDPVMDIPPTLAAVLP
jgi:hypothetical protein